MASQMLPNLSQGRWRYNHTETLKDGRHKGTSAYVFSYSVHHDEGYGDVIAVYKFYVTEEIALSHNQALIAT